MWYEKIFRWVRSERILLSLAAVFCAVRFACSDGIGETRQQEAPETPLELSLFTGCACPAGDLLFDTSLSVPSQGTSDRAHAFPEGLPDSPLHGAPRTLLNLCAARLMTTVTHELGHIEEATSQGLEAHLNIGTGVGEGTYSSAGNIGSFRYKGEPRDEARICLAGIESNLELYRTLSEEIRSGRSDSRLANTVACLAGLEFARYALWDAAAGSEASDIGHFCEATGTSRDFVYAAAVLSSLDFYLNGGGYHVKRALGVDAECKRSKGLFGTGLRAMSWIEDGNICVGLQFDVRF